MRIITLFFILFSAFSSSVFSATDMFMITDAGTSARMVRLGRIEGFSTVASGIFENPASLQETNRLSLSAFQTELIKELPYQNVAVAFRVPNFVLGIGYMGVTVTDIDKNGVDTVNDMPKPEGKFDYKSDVMKLSLTYSFSRRFHMGTALSVYHSSFDTVSGTGYNMDLGFFWDNPKLDASLTFRNVIPSQYVTYSDSTTDLSNSSDGAREKIPLQTVLSLRYSVKYMNFYGQIKKNGEQSGVSRCLGFEFVPPYVSFLRLSAGYKETIIPVQGKDSVTRTDVLESGPVFGVGLDLWGIQFDYALEKSNHVEYDTTHYFSAAYAF